METDKVQASADRIMTQIRDYMDARSISAIRINPRIGSIYEDVAYQQSLQMRIVLAGGKAFGPAKFYVSEILLSDDDKKVKDILNPTNQVSIMTEIIEQKEEGEKHAHQKRAGIMQIHDMPTFYSAMDPSLEKVILLIQSWIWWDLEDACDLVKFDATMQMIQSIEQNGVSEAMVQQYAEQFRMSPTQLSVDVVIAHELARAQDMVGAFKFRRESEEGYKAIIKREETPQNNPDQLIRALAPHYRVLDMIHQQGGVDDATRAAYAHALGAAPEALTLEQIAGLAERTVAQGKERLKASLSGQGQSGKPYDYKRWQYDRMVQRFEAVRAGREPQRLSLPKPDGSGGQRK